MDKQGKYGDQTINVFSKPEVERWCVAIGCERSELMSAVLLVGNSAETVNEYFKAKRKALWKRKKRK